MKWKKQNKQTNNNKKTSKTHFGQEVVLTGLMDAAPQLNQMKTLVWLKHLTLFGGFFEPADDKCIATPVIGVVYVLLLLFSQTKLN